MTRIQLSPADLANLRFATSAIWETVASTRTIINPAACPIDRERKPVSAEARRALTVLTTLNGIPGWLPDTLAATPRRAIGDANEFDDLATTPHAVLNRDLQTLRSHGLQPWLSMDAARYGALMHHCVSAVWREWLEPQWSTICEIHTIDLGRRMQLAQWHGVGAVLNSLHPNVSLHGSVLDVRVGTCTRLVASDGRGIVLVPSVFRWPNVAVSLDMPGPIVLSYPAIGTTAARRRDPGIPGDALERLIGATRATVLRDLLLPRTTSELSVRLSFAPSTVSEHLLALTRARLVVAHRQGKQVFYERTELGAALLDDALDRVPRQQSRSDPCRGR